MLRFVVLAAFALALPRAGAVDIWFTIAFDDKPIGYEQIQWKPIDDERISVLRRTQISFKRLGNDISLRATLSATQTRDGRLLDFRLERTDGSGKVIRRSGSMDAARRIMTTEEVITGSRRTRSDNLGAAPFSPFMELWMPGHMATAPGRTTFSVYFPESGGVANIVGERKLPRRIRLPDQKPQTRPRIAFYPAADATRVTTWYLDEVGDVLRSEKPMLNGTLSLTNSNADEALAAATSSSLDLDAQAIVPLSRLVDRRDSTRALQLDLSVKEGFVSDIPAGPDQETQRIDAQTVRITIAPRTAITEQPVDALKSTHWMTLEDPALKRLAAIAAGPGPVAAVKCQRMQDYFHAKIRPSPFSTGFATAQEVARNLRGDCTEHAMLLAAAMRCQGIPSRLAGGLASVGRRPGLVGHVWVEAWYDGAWHSFDSATGEDKTVVRIKLTDSMMPDESTTGLTLFLPVFELAGRASLTVVKD